MIIYNKDIPPSTIKELQNQQIIVDNDNEVITHSKSDKCNHNNFLEYLELGWGQHLGVTIDPKDFWYMILCEIAGIVKNDPDEYQELFTTSSEKTEITVLTGDPHVIPVQDIITQLKLLVPINIDTFFPDFSTKTGLYTLATQVAFCDTVSPFYSYSMFMCGIPSFTINGTVDDWELLYDNTIDLLNLLNVTSKFGGLIDTLQTLTSQQNRDDIAIWTSMFRLDQCGSGHQVEVSGWITDFYVNQPSVRYTRNFSSHVSSMSYTNLTLNKKYTMYSGLFHSTLTNDQIVPEYGWIVKEVKD
jgi:hypothetical protein